MNDLGKKYAIADQKIVFDKIKEIARKSPEQYADSLFDSKMGYNQGYEEKLSDKARFNFLKTVQLKDITFDRIDKHPFLLINNKTGEHLEISNRSTSNGELRGDILRNLLFQPGSEKSAYAAIAAYITSPKSDLVTYMRNLGVQVVNKGIVESIGWGMTEEHYRLYMGVLLQICKERMNKIEYLDDDKLNVMEDIDIAIIYDHTKEFSRLLNDINDNANDLESSGDAVAALQARQLHMNLTSEIKKLGETGEDFTTIQKNCQKHIKQANQEAFKGLHNLSRNIVNEILMTTLCCCFISDPKGSERTPYLQKIKKIPSVIGTLFTQTKTITNRPSRKDTLPVDDGKISIEEHLAPTLPSGMKRQAEHPATPTNTVETEEKKHGNDITTGPSKRH